MLIYLISVTSCHMFYPHFEDQEPEALQRGSHLPEGLSVVQWSMDGGDRGLCSEILCYNID